MSGTSTPRDRLCVLITNTNFSQRTGSELYVRDLALALQRMGHIPVVYSPRLGALADELRARAIPVVDDLQLMGQTPDLIHGQHHLETMTALARFPRTPAIYVCHGCLPWQEAPPVHPRILRYLAVNEAVRDRLVFEAGIDPEKISIALNFVDLQQFPARPSPLALKPAKALIFSNYASEANYVGIIRESCTRHGISLDVAGYASGNPCTDPGQLLGNYDLVFARGRAAIESLAVGAAVICCDHEGMGEMVTPENLEHMRQNNFGLRILDRPLRADQIDEQIDRYDADSASKVSSLIRASATIDTAVPQIVECYRKALGQWHAEAAHPAEPEGPAIVRYLRQTSILASRLEQQAGDWRQAHAELSSQLGQERASAEQARQALHATRDEAESARNDAAERKLEVDALQAQAQSLRTELQTATEQAQLVEHQANELRGQVLDLRDESDSLRAEARALDERARSLDDSLLALQQERCALREENAQLQQSVAVAEAGIASAASRVESLAAEVERTQQETATSVAALVSGQAIERIQWQQASEQSEARHADEMGRQQSEAVRLQAMLQRVHDTLTWRVRNRLLALAPVRAAQRSLMWLRQRRAHGKLPAPTNAAGTGSVPEHDLSQAQLACVVMGLGNPESLVDAVRSLQSQDLPVEIVVVNSGGGNPVQRLRAAGIEVKIVHRPDVLYAGAVRNLGIASTTAPYVAFLAADCLAEPGWIRARIERHQAGIRAVSSAVTPARPRNLWSWVSYLNLFALRMPGVPAESALHYGVSYERSLFNQFGLFNEQLRTGEDSEFNKRLSGVDFSWTPQIRSAHAHPTSLPALLRDQYARGARIAAAWESLSGKPSRRLVAKSAFRRVPALLRTAWGAAEPGQKTRIALAALLMPPAIAAYALGALRGAAPVAPDSLGKAAARPRLLALLTFHDEMRYLPDYFANLATHVDGIIALDDGSTDGSGEFVAAQASVKELIRLPRRTPHVWDEPRNRRLLVEAALRHGADWLVVVDADERVECDFRRRAEAEMAQAEAEGTLVLTAVMRELWNHADHFRSDGIWDRKRPARLFKARQDHDFDDRSLHGHWAPLNSLGETTCREADLIIYHLRMLSESERRERQAKYQRLDPDRQFQPIGYDYLTDTAELRLQRLPDRREYQPLPPA